MELEIHPCKYTDMSYEAQPQFDYRTLKLSIDYTRRYMDEFFGKSTKRQIDIYVNHRVRIKFWDEEMYTMFKLAHG